MPRVYPDPQNDRRQQSQVSQGVLAEIGNVGQCVFRDAMNQFAISSSDVSVNTSKADVVGMLIDAGTANDQAAIITDGLYWPGVALVPSAVYCVATDGYMIPKGELGPYERVLTAGVADDNGQYIDLGFKVTESHAVPATAYQGTWDAATNTPNIGAGAPYAELSYWQVSVEGTQTFGPFVNQLFRVGEYVIYDPSATAEEWRHVPHPPPGPDEVEGEKVLSTGVAAGEVLTANGDNSSGWAVPGAEGVDVKSTGVLATYRLTADGLGASVWAPVEGTEIASTGETGGVRFLQELGNDKSAWADLPVSDTNKQGIIQSSDAAGLSAASGLAVTNNLVSVDPDLSQDGGLLALRQDIEARYIQPAPSDGRIYGYYNGSWVDITPGFGGMNMTTPTAGADIGAGWNALTYFDNVVTDGPGIALDPVTGTWQFEEVGVWQYSINIAFEHNSDNSYRQTNLRFFNVADGTPGPSVPFGAGRQAEDTFVSVTAQAVVEAADLNDVIRLEIGGGDSFTGVTYNILSVYFDRKTQMTTLNA